ncbi:hypothetical protein J2W42_006565 [Rhizobium tibeticum]|nr:hypothetical protein [Rhizobium tibeticum]
MRLIDTRIEHEPRGWRIDFLGDDGDAVSVRVAGGADMNEAEAVERARDDGSVDGVRHARWWPEP